MRGVANDVQVRRGGEPTETDVAKAAVDALKWDVTVPLDRINVKVNDDRITLTSNVCWDFQRRAAERADRELSGVRGISNRTTVTPEDEQRNLKKLTEETSKREAAVDARNTTSMSPMGQVTLRASSERVAIRVSATRIVNISTLATLLAISTPFVTAGDVEPIRVPVAGDDDGAKSVVADLVVDPGLQPVDIGRLAASHVMEPDSIARAALAATYPSC